MFLITQVNYLNKSETEVELSTGNWKTLTKTKENGSFSFPGVPMRNDWLLTATEGLITDDEEPCVPEPAPGPACPQPPQKRAFAFVTPDKSDYTLILKDPKLKGSYEIIKSAKTDIGFWTGDVDEKENYVLLINGMENWNKVPESDSKLYLFTLDGDLIWTHDLTWEGWNADLSPDSNIPLLSQNILLSPSPSNATPRSALLFTTAEDSSSRLYGVGSGPLPEKSPSIS